MHKNLEVLKVLEYKNPKLSSEESVKILLLKQTLTLIRISRRILEIKIVHPILDVLGLHGVQVQGVKELCEALHPLEALEEVRGLLNEDHWDSEGNAWQSDMNTLRDHETG